MMGLLTGTLLRSGSLVRWEEQHCRRRPGRNPPACSFDVVVVSVPLMSHPASDARRLAVRRWRLAAPLAGALNDGTAVPLALIIVAAAGLAGALLLLARKSLRTV